MVQSVECGLSEVVSVFLIIFRKDKRGIDDIIGGTYVASAK